MYKVDFNFVHSCSGAAPLTQTRSQQSGYSADSELSPHRTSSSNQQKRSVLGLHP
ncbi:hypothetical protein COCSADRAFT_267130 [Bipolaris sorokiniana ND90Pr]|uniref:Uncharacterized protein n=1 Tax=Cochliobolus sativus (strain ND90Pr / ATCC 201652) TaxID=665912 RepID=M2T065_COCSN|nr:uncharacterized protein COCSADRAFT_267130 [Bipolaris sorokiniana ND90Pr]EMD67955.1 hypothetical protein COCSADRAFT_267130 [Bipolaris sorokiniana ND90Pr]